MATNGWIKTTALADEAVDTDALEDGVLSADTAGRAKMAANYLQLTHIPDNLITLDKLNTTKLLYSGAYGYSEYGRCVYA